MDCKSEQRKPPKEYIELLEKKLQGAYSAIINCKTSFAISDDDYYFIIKVLKK